MKKCNIGCWSLSLSKSKHILTVFFVITASINFIYAGIYKPTTLDVTPKATLEELQKGRELYINNCASCHSLHQPEKFDTIQWKKSMEKMAPKAKISKEDKELILKYLIKGQ
jgi:cytochrome c1